MSYNGFTIQDIHRMFDSPENDVIVPSQYICKQVNDCSKEKFEFTGNCVEYLIPEWAVTESEEFIDSEVLDGAIYTTIKHHMTDNEVADILYVNDCMDGHFIYVTYSMNGYDIRYDFNYAK